MPVTEAIRQLPDGGGVMVELIFGLDAVEGIATATRHLQIAGTMGSRRRSRERSDYQQRDQDSDHGGDPT